MAQTAASAEQVAALAERLATHAERIQVARRDCSERAEHRDELRARLAKVALAEMEAVRATLAAAPISAPPSFAAPSPWQAEGYWSAEYWPQRFVHSGLSEAWGDKNRFLSAVSAVERAICLGDAADAQSQGLGLIGVIPGASFVAMDGSAPSRLDDTVVGSGEFCDACEGGQIRWPEGYAQHYIGTHDVVPTRRFFQYVVRRVNGGV